MIGSVASAITNVARPAVSVVIPARNARRDLSCCLAHLIRSKDISFELIVVDDASTDATSNVAQEFGARVIRLASRSGPAVARNRGAAEARADVLVFVDADVLVRPETLSQLANRLKQGCDAVFGSYDQHPSSPNLVAQYKNLLHHFVHQRADREASTFWAGCGAVRGRVFAELGGFSEAYRRPCIEDIEFGVRMKNAGRRIELDPDIQVTHLKRWTLATLVRADVLDRALPWTQLILEQGVMPNDLNLKTSQKLCVILSLSLAVYVVGASWHEPSVLLLPIAAGCAVLSADLFGTQVSRARHAEQVAAAALVATFAIITWKLPFIGAVLALKLMALLVVNHVLFRFFLLQRGLGFAVMSLPLQLLYYCYSGAAFGWGCARHVAHRMKCRIRQLFYPIPTLADENRRVTS